MRTHSFNYVRFFLFSGAFMLWCTHVQAQFEGQIPGMKKYKFVEVYDSTYGIVLYDKLNFQLGGDSVRNDKKGYAAQGWHEDYYMSGALLHKGYYEDGQLKVYKNYYENGQLERSFKVTDLKRCSMQSYYQDGKLKSDVDYYDGNPQRWNDYFPNGQLEYSEENTKNMDYVIFRRSYFENGQPESLFEMTDKGKKAYVKKEFYTNGKVKEEGVMKYFPAQGDYVKDGEWKTFGENGSVLTKENFVKGEKAE